MKPSSGEPPAEPIAALGSHATARQVAIQSVQCKNAPMEADLRLHSIVLPLLRELPGWKATDAGYRAAAEQLEARWQRANGTIRHTLFQSPAMAHSR